MHLSIMLINGMHCSSSAESGRLSRKGAALQKGQVDNTRAQLEHMSIRMREAEEEFARFFAQSLDMLCIAGLDGYFKRINPAWTNTLGWSLQELQALPFLEFVHPDDREATQAEFVMLTEGSDTVLFENRYRHKDGTYRWFQWNARPLPGHQEIYATARDITMQKRLEGEILGIVDQERARLGQELHDGLCQTLAGIAALSFALSRRLSPDSEPAAATAAEITQMLNQAIGQARDMAQGFSPMGLDEMGLEAALKDLAQTVKGQHGISCAFQNHGRFRRHRPEVESHLYRIAQEALRNAITHGRANRIEINLLNLDDSKGVLSVRDDGVGLPEETLESEGIGLQTMVYRSHLIGASLEVKPRARRGTEVTCIFPLPEPPEHECHARNKS